MNKTTVILFCLFMQFICMIFAPVSATPSEAAFLSNVAKEYMKAQFPADTREKKYVVKAGKLDSNREYGGKCTGFLTAELVGSEIRRSNVVKITCSRKVKPYTINVPVSVTIYRASTIAAVNIPKGAVISQDMIEDTYVNESTNTAAAITDRSMVVGSKARKDIKAGEQIRISDFCLISKGDVVAIEANSKNLSIKAQGIALEEGKLNDQIQVRNSKSGKIIYGVVRGPGLVEVIF